jgi:hypothetical protein
MSQFRTRRGLNYFAPRLELLDDRVVPSCTVVQEGGLLRIEGDQHSNTISIVDDGATVTVTCDDGTAEEFTDVTEIEVRGGNGQDVVTYDLTIADPAAGETGTAVTRSVDVKLGNGIDSFEGSVTGDLVDGSAVDVTVKGCNGKDALAFDMAGDVAADATLDVLLNGGNGKDEMLTSYAGVLLGTLTWGLEGGNGKDVLSVETTFDAGSTGTADVEVKGERAPDEMTLLVTDNSGDDGDPNTTDDPSTLGTDSSFTVDGGSSHDSADVSDVVEVISAKEKQ